MPSFAHHGASIYYEEFGQGFPILTFAPAGLQSTIAVWHRPSAPVNPITEFSANFRVIALDQRNAGGQSHAPITAHDGWHTYMADHIAHAHHDGAAAVLGPTAGRTAPRTVVPARASGRRRRPGP